MTNFPESDNMSTSNSSGNFSTAQRVFFQQYYSHFIASIIIGNAICLFALASNIICLIAIFTQPRLRQQGNALVANLIMVNILLSLFVYPISIVSPMYRQYYELASTFCDWIFFYYFMVQAFVWHECLLAFNRFVAILIPHYYKNISSKKCLAITVIVGYLIPFMINSYGLQSDSSIFWSSLPFGSCQFRHEVSIVFLLFHSILGVYLPIVVIGLGYFMIFLAVHLRKRRVVRDRGFVAAGLSAAREAKRMRIAKMLFVSYLWNTVTYIPQPILSVLVKDVYRRYPPTFFYLRYALCFGLAGNVVCPSFRVDVLILFVRD